MLTKEPDPDRLIALLDGIVAAFGNNDGTIADHISELSKSIYVAECYLHSLRVCEFVEESGRTCIANASEESFGMKCCQYHSNIRNASLK